MAKPSTTAKAKSTRRRTKKTNFTHKKRRTAGTPAAPPPQMHDAAQSLSNFIYYRANGMEINVDVRMGTILSEHCEAIAFTVNENMNPNAALVSKVLAKTGVAPAVRKEISRMKRLKSYLAGDVAAVDLNLDNECGWRTLMFVVTPHEPTLFEAYKNIFRVCKEKEITNVAIVGLGCGQLGISPRTSSRTFMEALMAFDRQNDWSTKTIAVLDVKREVVESFISQLQDFVHQHHYKPNNKEKLVFISNDNLLDYEARRLTSFVKKEEVDDTDCVVCLCPLREDFKPESLCALKCGHQFHFECFKSYLKQCSTRKCCPVCRKYFSVPCGNQPLNATMQCYRTKMKIAGFDDIEYCIVIHYDVPSGIQDNTHLRPGLPYRGTMRVAYLPDNADGRQVLRLLKKAFECRLIFTVGDSVTTGQTNVVTWNNIHHKTSPRGGTPDFGFPDETYFVRVRAELEEAGVTEDLLSEDDLQEINLPEAANQT